VPRAVIVYRGWIGAKESDRTELEGLGVEVSGPWNPIGAFDRCAVPRAAYEKFVRTWQGRGVWGLIGKVETVFTPEEQKKMAEDEDIPF
jgi:hypothetical protein